MDTVTTITTPQEEESDYLDISEDDYQVYSGERLFGFFYLCANTVWSLLINTVYGIT